MMIKYNSIQGRGGLWGRKLFTGMDGVLLGGGF
jgi:hypothetical protein